MAACEISSMERRTQVRVVGNDLLRHYGRKPHYSIAEVRLANQRQKIDIDVVCWSHAVFNTHLEFDAYHASIGEVCDYCAMKAEMLASVSTAAYSSWFDVELSWLEFPDLDWSIFDIVGF